MKTSQIDSIDHFVMPTAMIPVRFNPADYSVTEGVDSNAVITLEAFVAHPFDFTVTVLTQDGSAIGESYYHTYSTYILWHFLAECIYTVHVMYIAEYMCGQYITLHLHLLLQDRSIREVLSTMLFYDSVRIVCLPACYTSHSVKAKPRTGMLLNGEFINLHEDVVTKKSLSCHLVY